MTTGPDISLSYEPVPRSAIRLYSMIWQLESWLRTIVYVELRAARFDWQEPIKKHVRRWPPSSQAHDKELYHMATPHEGALSYLSFAELWKVVSDGSSWPLFETYFPPKSIAEAKIDEIKTIRNRVAHFREPHQQDEARFTLFMRDMEAGLRSFCSWYTTGRIQKEGVTARPLGGHRKEGLPRDKLSVGV